jgi:hypothetical protein
MITAICCGQVTPAGKLSDNGRDDELMRAGSVPRAGGGATVDRSETRSVSVGGDEKISIILRHNAKVVFVLTKREGS